MKKKLLFLCTGNSCRSQMAEGYLRDSADELFEVYSAGLEPSIVNPIAIKVMKESGVDISHHTSKDVNQFIGQEFDYIVTVCDNARERCPYFPSRSKKFHHSFPDPAKARGTDEEVMNQFRKVRNVIKEYVKRFIKEEFV